MIPVSKPFMPNRTKYFELIDRIFDNNILTNNGPYVQKLTADLKNYLNVEYLLLVTNGTIALQIAYKTVLREQFAKKTSIEAITTPFSFVATTSSLLWEGIKVEFSDIDPQTWCLDPHEIKSKINEKTKLIVPTHVFGNACEVEIFDELVENTELKIVYDAAHAFDSVYDGESILKWGDAATLSFHATKIFHTIEGGAIIFKNKDDYEYAQKLINFGISNEGDAAIGINGKMSEFNAAMGLAVLEDFQKIKTERLRVKKIYDEHLPSRLKRQKIKNNLIENNSYMPVLFETEYQLLQVMEKLKNEQIYIRRYFWPSLNKWFNKKETGLRYSEFVSDRIACLPLFVGLDEATQFKIINVIKDVMK